MSMPLPVQAPPPQILSIDDPITARLWHKLQSRRFNADNPPKPSVPRFWIGGVPVSTVGNLTAISAAAKSGKSSFIGAMIGAAMSGGGKDCLNVHSSNKNNGALIHFDTEQSAEDHDALVRVALRRARLETPPDWLWSFCVTGLDPKELQAALKDSLSRAIKEFGSIHSVILDGAADMVTNVNDPDECNPFVRMLHALAIVYSCAIVCVIHLNPNSRDKTRGHLGSQLERKAESNLRLKHDRDAFICYADKNRKAPILEADGPRWKWSNEHQMHVLTKSKQALSDDVENQQLHTRAKHVFGDKASMRHSEIKSAWVELYDVTPRTGERAIKRMTDLGVIIKLADGSYSMAEK